MTVVETYTLQFIRDADDITPPLGLLVLPEAIAEAEENLTDLLPDGYRAKIQRWDEGDEPDA